MGELRPLLDRWTGRDARRGGRVRDGEEPTSPPGAGAGVGPSAASTDVAPERLPRLGPDSRPPPRSYGIGAWGRRTRAGSSAPGATVGSAHVVVAPRSGPTPPSSRRRPIVAGNWKLHPPTRSEARNLLLSLAAAFAARRRDDATPDVVVFPPLPYVADAVGMLEGTDIQVGAQNAGPNEKGAYTGEVAPSMLASIGCSYILLGHSERRALFGETDEQINAALRKCLEQPDLKVILCVGETLEEYEAGLLESIVDIQICKGLEGVNADALLNDRVIVAYEPVWAIGTGLVATPSQAQAAHLAIRNSLTRLYGSDEVAARVRIQYGGSVTPDSAEQLMSEMDVDGALVGGASLDADSFARIIDGGASADVKKKKGPA